MENKSARTTQELFELLKANHPEQTEAVDTTTVRYALYARKSTQDDERQERSIEDQVQDCVERVIVPERLILAQDPILESYSAKEPDVRPKFRRLIEDIKSGRITGLIAWHPDRLARNMKEAGEIIDLLDKGTLKDLRFATSTFENNPTGKMLLGISFVLSKQYSEHLSESVTRGNKRSTEDGRFLGKLKHGYYVNEDRRLFPDGDNFLFIREAFKRRMEGATQKDIAAWLNTTTYRVRRYKKDPQATVWDKDMVSKMLRDPVYAGVLKYGKHLVDLMPIYDFTPVVTVEEFMKLNRISSLDSAKLVSTMMVKSGNIRADLLRGLVTCAYCNKTFSSGLTSKTLKTGRIRYYNYKCETEDCSFYNKSIRANVVLLFAKEFFEGYMFVTKENYDGYVANAKRLIDRRIRETNSSIASLSKTLGEKRKEYEETKELIRVQPVLAPHYDLDAIQQQIDRMTVDLNKLKAGRGEVKHSIATYEKYLELIKHTSVILEEMHNMKAMDLLLREFFSNFTIKATGTGKQREYEIDYKLKEPYQGFLENGKFVLGRGERTQTFDLSVPNRARYQLRHTPM